MKITPTAEQTAVVGAAQGLQPGQVLTVNAYAGTGKTSTATLVAEAMPRARILYICFNREMAEEARRRFPANCDCRTAHSLAYGAFGASRYARKLGTPRPHALKAALRMDESTARTALEIVNRFMASDAASIGHEHVEAAAISPSASEKQMLLRAATDVWRAMLDPKNEAVVLPHDGYLKGWAVGLPPPPRYDLLIVDEAQDLNPVLLGLVRHWRARGLPVMVVGDTHQSIYGFRMAIDAMQVFGREAVQTLRLTESWRFGPAVASAASRLLADYKADNTPLVGRGGAKKHATHGTLARSNAKLIEAALDFIGGRKLAKVHFAGTKADKNYDPTDAYRFGDIEDAYRLWSGGRAVGASLARFGTYEELCATAKQVDDKGGEIRDPELAPLVDFVDRLGGEVPRALLRIRNASAGPEVERHFSTAHRAKGKEWGNVTLLDDFPPLDDSVKLEKFRQKRTEGQFSEEINLLYVAVTRGQAGFQPAPSAARYFAAARSQAVSQV
jgi:superfamily I DNA/RNA helicase